VEHLGCFQSLAIVNSAAVNMDVQVAPSYPWVHSFRYMPQSSSSGSYGSSTLSFLMDLHTASHSSCTNLHSHQQCRSVPFSLHPHLHLFLFVLMVAILTKVRWNLNVVWICISFMAKDVEQILNICLVAIWTSFENCLFSSLAHLFSGFWFFERLVFELSVYSVY
jgi:hypothetical protein